MVRSLYVARDQQHFRSHHALRLTYRSKGVSAEHRRWERCAKPMERIGATDFLHLPSRPKFMRRRTYQQVCDGINEIARAMRRALARDELLFRDSKQWQGSKRIGSNSEDSVPRPALGPSRYGVPLSRRKVRDQLLFRDSE
jgi:hypothetical protein